MMEHKERMKLAAKIAGQTSNAIIDFDTDLSKIYVDKVAAYAWKLLAAVEYEGEARRACFDDLA